MCNLRKLGREPMAFAGGMKNCPRIIKGARLYEPRDYEVLLKVILYILH